MAKRRKIEPTTMQVPDAVSHGFSALEELGSECREVCDNMPESLQSTSRYEALDSSASELEGLSEPSWPGDADDAPLQCTWTDSTRTSRAARRDSAVSALSAAVAAIDDRVSDLEELETKHDDAGTDEDEQASLKVREVIDALEEYRDEVQSAIDAADGCEFPGMFG